MGDEAQVRRPRMSDADRARLGAEAWALKDRQGMSSRQIFEKFKARGEPIGSHVQVWRLIKEAYEQAEFLDLIGPAEMRMAVIGRLETVMEKLLAGMETGEIDLDKGTARYISLEQVLIRLTGAAMPTRVAVTNDGPERATPDLVFLEEMRKARAQAARMEEMEANDGLMD